MLLGIRKLEESGSFCNSWGGHRNRESKASYSMPIKAKADLGLCISITYFSP